MQKDWDKQMPQNNAFLTFVLIFFIAFGVDKKGKFKNLSRKGNIKEAAQNLYHFIYLADNNDLYENISIAPIPYKKIGLAINDRLLRASK